MKKPDPVLSVIMPVYNGEKYLAEAINSVLEQTFEDFELIIINDGSADNSDHVVRKFSDARINYVENERNMGVAHTRNRGLQLAKGRYLAWMDCDDLIDVRRFEKQVDFMEKNPDYGLCGTWLERFGNGNSGAFRAPTNPQIIRATLLFKPSIPNATAMLRLSVVRKHKLLYDETLPIAEDYHFVFRCSKYFKMTNLPEILYRYRDSETSIMKKFGSEESRHFSIHKAVYRETLKYLGLEPEEEHLYLHWKIASPAKVKEASEYRECFGWLLRLREVNGQTKVYNQNAFDQVLGEMFYFVSAKSSGIGLSVFMFYVTKSYAAFGMPPLKKVLKLAYRCMMKYDVV